ncbi:MAG: hypothetical protein ACI3YB_01920 [Prevotella sp.]
MQIRKTALSLCAATILVGCGQKLNNEKLIKDFLDKNITDKDISEISFSRTDSTVHVSDSTIRSLRAKSDKLPIFRKNIEYGERRDTKKMYYVNVEYKTSDGEKMRHTFYIDAKMQNVVCVKTDNPALWEKKY